MTKRKSTSCALKSAERKETGTAVTWLDGDSSFYHWVWLRDNDPSQKLSSGQRLFETADLLNSGTAFEPPQHLQVQDNGDLNVVWDSKSSSSYTAEWLYAHSYAPHHVFKRRAEDPMTPLLWNEKFRCNLPRFDWDKLATDDAVYFSAVKSFTLFGFCLVTGAGTSTGRVLEVARRFGHVRATNYGELFDVKTQEGCNNLAYSSQGLSVHTDNPYRSPTPGVQLLHCINPAEDGSGETIIVDGFAAAERLKQRDPDAFRLLTTCPQPFRYTDNASTDLRNEDPMISLDLRGNVKSVQVNNRSAAPLVLHPSKVEPYYRAVASFWGELRSAELEVRIPLAAGEVAIFLNNRVLHGRSAFTASAPSPTSPPGAPRHLQGCYIDYDAVRSTMQSLCSRGLDAPLPFDATVERVMQVLETGAQQYYGEGLNTKQHALQAACCAVEAGEDDTVVIASLCHDIGHLEGAAGEGAEKMHATGCAVAEGESVGVISHELLGARFMSAQGFPDCVADLINGHVEAKRYLVSKTPSYFASLSAASVETLRIQGGPMSETQMADFEKDTRMDVKLRMRKFDEEAKYPEKVVPDFDAYATTMRNVLMRECILNFADAHSATGDHTKVSPSPATP